MNEEQVPSEFDMILDRCLDAVVSGQLTLAECLERYPEYADLLKPELQIALLTSRLKSPDMEGAQVEALEMRLRAKMDAQRPRSNNIIYLGRLPISRMAAAILITFMLAFGSGAGLVAASADSVPGETLYPVKRLWEEILLFLASLTGQTDDVWLHLAEVRLDEVLELYQRGDLDENTLRDLYKATGNAIRYADTDTAPKTVNYLSRAEQSLEQINPPPPLAGLLGDVRRIMLPTYDASGHLQPPSSNLPPSLLVTPSPAATATDLPLQASPTATLTAEPTLTATDTPTLTLTPTVTNTPTPLIPPTATRTPTPTPSPTRTPSPTVTPSATWTELPIPVGPSATPNQFPTVSQPTSVSGATATSVPSDPNYWLRETQRAVYMTQTAGPPTTEEPSP